MYERSCSKFNESKLNLTWHWPNLRILATQKYYQQSTKVNWSTQRSNF